VRLLEIGRPHPATDAAEIKLCQPTHCNLRIVRCVFHRAFLLRSLYFAIGRIEKAIGALDLFAFISYYPIDMTKAVSQLQSRLA